MRRTIVDPRFPAILAQLIMGSGVSQNALARQASVSRSYLSQIINGRRTPSIAVARALDTALAAGGRLTNLVVLAARADDLDELAAAAASPRRAAASPAVIETFERVLVNQRYLDDRAGSAALVGPVMAQMETVDRMVAEAAGAARPPLLYVAAQWAQFAGWLHTSTGKYDKARHWFDVALEWSTEHGNPDLTATVVSYLGHVAWLSCQWGPSVGLAQAALRNEDVYPGQRAYDAFQAARGLAALGDVPGAERMLDLGNQLAEETAAWAGPVPAWQYYRAPWLWSLERGLVLLYIARHDGATAHNAVAQLRAGLNGMPDEYRGSDWSAEYMTHLATAHLYADDPDTAELVLERAREIAETTQSRRVLHMIEGRERRLLWRRETS